MSFDHWMKAVDLIVLSIIGVDTTDLADQPYRDWYHAGMSPQEAVEEIRAMEGF